MGRKSRHSAKTGDQSLYKSRSKTSDETQQDDEDDDPMYNEVERYHNRKEEENYLKLDVDDGEGDDTSDDGDDGITKNREGVFDLGIGGSSDEEDEDDSDSEDERAAAQGAKRKRAAAMEAELASSDEDDDDSGSDEDDEDEEARSHQRILNWGDNKQSYYHGDTADLEIGQDEEDAYLEEEAGREVEKARLDGMDDADFMLDDDQEYRSGMPEKSKSKKRSKDERMETIQSVKRTKQLSKLSKKKKLKLLKAGHPELLPLVQHFSEPIRELSETTMVAAGALLKNGVAKGGKEAEAVGATQSGLQYLITKSMLQASKALNLSIYLLLKSDQAPSNNSLDMDIPLMEYDYGDGIRNHPVMDRLNQLSQLTDKLQEGVEEKTQGLKEQMDSLVKAAALMAGGELSSGSSDDSSDEENEANSSDVQGDAEAATKVVEQPVPDDDIDNIDESPSSDSDDEENDSQEAIQRRIITEAKFALRNQDIVQDVKKSAKRRKRRLAPSSSDYGDEAEENTGKSLEASRKLASTMNSIVQKSNTSNDKKKISVGDEEGDDDDYDRLQRGLSMMEEEFKKGSDDDDEDDDEEEGIHDSADDDDFYQKIKTKTRSKKEAKKQMYAVAPKYPRLEGLVEGERSIGKTIMKNRGLVAHKPKINRNPRVKKREQYRKALIRRRGAVREVRNPEEGHAYGGEDTGIKSGISRSRKLAGR